MCVSFSGRCLLSAYLTGRDANQGACAQPCRWKYRLMEETRPGQYFPVEEHDEGTYIMNAKDLCMIDHIPELLAAGVDSLKLEGRAKSSYYVAVVTNAYRSAVDAYLQQPEGFVLPEWIREEVYKVSHRGYCTASSSESQSLGSGIRITAMTAALMSLRLQTTGEMVCYM